MPIISLGSCAPFDLEATVCCGQAFRWEKLRDWWYGVVGEQVLKIRQDADRLEFENASADSVKYYFGLQDDLPKILTRINRDKHIEEAINRFKGLRILHQDPWECLISYICATYKSVPAIKSMVKNLSRKFGNEITVDGYAFHTFPTPGKLAQATTSELVGSGLGYRTRYVAETARIVKRTGFDFEHLKLATYEEAKKELLAFLGVGFKVADCVMLFSLNKLEAFPVDVWMKRVILKYYAKHFPNWFAQKISARKSPSNSEYREMNLFGREYFGEYAGYAQEYLYHYERMCVKSKCR